MTSALSDAIINNNNSSDGASGLKKRKLDKEEEEEKEDGDDGTGAETIPALDTVIDSSVASKLLDCLSQDQIVETLLSALIQNNSGVLEQVRKHADKDPSHRKIFVRGLGSETNTDSLKSVFAHYGELEEGIVIMDKNTGKSRGYGFVTFKHMDGALIALRNPSKRIDGRMVVCQLASAGPAAFQQPQDVASRKLFVGNVPLDLPTERLLNFFAQFGEIEEGPLGFDKQTGKARGFALFIYKSADSAQRALEEPAKLLDGNQIFCKLAVEGHKSKQNQDTQNSTNPPYGTIPGGPTYTQNSNYSLDSSMPTLNSTLNSAALNQGLNRGLTAATTPYSSSSSSLQTQIPRASYLNPYSTQSQTAPTPPISYNGQTASYPSSGYNSIFGASQGSYTASIPPSQPTGVGQYSIPSYQNQSLYQNQSIYQNQPSHQSQTSYQSQSTYQNQPSYQSQSAYQNQLTASSRTPPGPSQSMPGYYNS